MLVKTLKAIVVVFLVLMFAFIVHQCGGDWFNSDEPVEKTNQETTAPETTLIERTTDKTVEKTLPRTGV